MRLKGKTPSVVSGQFSPASEYFLLIDVLYSPSTTFAPASEPNFLLSTPCKDGLRQSQGDIS